MENGIFVDSWRIDHMLYSKITEQKTPLKNTIIFKYFCNHCKIMDMNYSFKSNLLYYV